MSYKLYTDKINEFKCAFEVEGTSLNKAIGRIILETNNISYLFKGHITENGVCEFELPKLKGILNEGSTGTIKLEVIADDVHFEPWSSDYIVDVNKKISVTIQEQTEIVKKPTIKMNSISLTEVVEPVKESIKEIVQETIIQEQVVQESNARITKEDLLKYIKSKK